MSDQDNEIKSNKWIKDYVLMVIEEVKDIPRKEREKVPFRQKMAAKHQTFFYKFPQILMQVVDAADEFDMEQFEMLLSMREKVNTGEADIDKTNEGVRNKYYNKYVASNPDLNLNELSVPEDVAPELKLDNTK